MPWTTPTLKDVRKLTRDYVLSQLGARAMLPNSVLRIMSDAMSGLASLTLLYLDWLSKQMLPDTAEQEWLDRHGVIWLTNSDGSKGRKAATFATGTVLFTGDPGVEIPSGTLVKGADVDYQTSTMVEVAPGGTVQAEVTAQTSGLAGNVLDGTSMSIEGLAGVTTAIADGDITGGIDTESDDELRERVLFRIQNPPMGGSQADYVAWATAVPGVTRAWANVEMGVGTMTVRFLMDDLRAEEDGWPLPEDVIDVTEYLDSKRPVTVKELYVVEPIKQLFDVVIADLHPNTDQVKGEIEAQLKDMLFRKAAPGQTIYAVWISHAIMNAPSIIDFRLVSPTDVIMSSVGNMGVLDSVTYE